MIVTFCPKVDLSYELSTVEYLDQLMQYMKLSQVLCYLIFLPLFSFDSLTEKEKIRRLNFGTLQVQGR